MAKTYAEINERIKKGETVVVIAEEMVDICTAEFNQQVQHSLSDCIIALLVIFAVFCGSFLRMVSHPLKHLL